jgi:hypothetical protein
LTAAESRGLNANQNCWADDLRTLQLRRANADVEALRPAVWGGVLTGFTGIIFWHRICFNAPVSS